MQHKRKRSSCHEGQPQRHGSETLPAWRTDTPPPHLHTAPCLGPQGRGSYTENQSIKLVSHSPLPHPLSAVLALEPRLTDPALTPSHPSSVHISSRSTVPRKSWQGAWPLLHGCQEASVPRKSLNPKPADTAGNTVVSSLGWHLRGLFLSTDRQGLHRLAGFRSQRRVRGAYLHRAWHVHTHLLHRQSESPCCPTGLVEACSH